MVFVDLNITNSVIDSFIRIKEDYFVKNLTYLNEIIDSYVPISKVEKEQIKNKSINFNVFDFFKINEPTHSTLIASLLDPKGNHGQGNIFLKEFLKSIEIDFNDDDIWLVTAEIGRIDILLKCLNRNSVIIIENKSNEAIDQPNQLYRYWYQEMYFPYEFSGKIDDCLNQINNFRIIYLAPRKEKTFDMQSLNKPIDFINNLDLPSCLNSKSIQHLTFSEIIVPWLKKCLILDSLEKENHRIREFIKQYIKLWETNY